MEEKVCKKIVLHVHECHHCKRKLSFDPVEKALLKSVSIKNDVIELIAYIFNGLFILYFVKYVTAYR